MKQYKRGVGPRKGVFSIQYQPDISDRESKLLRNFDQNFFNLPYVQAHVLILVNLCRPCFSHKDFSIYDNFNSPFPSSGLPLSQSESSCKTFHMKTSLICMKMNLNGFALRLVLTQRQTRTRKLAIMYLYYLLKPKLA